MIITSIVVLVTSLRRVLEVFRAPRALEELLVLVGLQLGEVLEVFVCSCVGLLFMSLCCLLLVSFKCYCLFGCLLLLLGEVLEDQKQEAPHPEK